MHPMNLGRFEYGLHERTIEDFLDFTTKPVGADSAVSTLTSGSGGGGEGGGRGGGRCAGGTLDGGG